MKGFLAQLILQGQTSSEANICMDGDMAGIGAIDR